MNSIVNELKINVAQLPEADFSWGGKKQVRIRTSAHELVVLGDGLADGEWVFSGSEKGTIRDDESGGVSAAYINNLYPIQNNSTTLLAGYKASDQEYAQNISFIGTMEQDVTAQQVNVLTAASLSSARLMLEDANGYPGNKIIVFHESTMRILTERDSQYGREDDRIMCRFSFGVIFHGDYDDKINTGELSHADLINTCVYIKPEKASSFAMFDRELESGYTGNGYYSIYLFNYEENIFDKDLYDKRKFYFVSEFVGME